MATESRQIIFTKKPTGDIIPSETFAPKTVPLPTVSDLKGGEVLVEVLYLSLDPIMRYWIEGNFYKYVNVQPGNVQPGNVQPGNVQPGNIMHGQALVRVVASRSENIKIGDVGLAWPGWATHATLSREDFQKREVAEGSRLTDFMNVLGTTGLTGYLGMEREGRPKTGETVVVSTAAGATGSVAAQVAKIKGARVIGITGSEDKVEWLKGELGLEEALNYRDADFEERFAEAVKGGIDVYFDNVGGRMLELALDNLSRGGRIAICGDISSYNNPNPRGIRNHFEIALRDATMKGVNVYTYLPEQEAANVHLLEWIRDGKLKRTETVVKGTLEDAPATLVELFKGKNTGKMLLEIKDPEA